MTRRDDLVAALAAARADRDARSRAAIAKVEADLQRPASTVMIAARPVRDEVVSTLHVRDCGCTGFKGTVGRALEVAHPDEVGRATPGRCLA